MTSHSWWWQHNIPTSSNWLRANLEDMDAKVKEMIKIIEEDADSFAKRAEMYYKKRPELMKMVEEFYRGYRALAERYDHAQGELCHVQQTITEALTDQVPFELPEHSASSTSGHETEFHTSHALLDSDELDKDLFGPSVSKQGSSTGESNSGISMSNLKELNEMFGASEEGKLSKGQSKETYEIDRSLHNNIMNLKAKVLSESERASKAEAEVRTLKEALAAFKTKKDAGVSEQREYPKKIANLDAHKDVKGVDDRTFEEDSETQYLRNKVSRLESEKKVGLVQYKQSLNKISVMENQMSVAKEDVKMLHERAVETETEVENLKRTLFQKEYLSLLCEQCLENISKLESD